MDVLLKGKFEPNKSIQIQHFQNKVTDVYLKSPHCFHTSPILTKPPRSRGNEVSWRFDRHLKGDGVEVW